MSILLQPIEDGGGFRALGGLRPLFLKPSGRQQLPQLVGEPRRWSVWSAPFEDFVYYSHISSDVGERITPRNNLYNEPYDISVHRGRDTKALASKIVMPSA